MSFWKRQPKPRMRVPQLDRLLRCWHLSRRHHEWNPPASDQRIDHAESIIGRKHPRVLRAIYEFSDGFAIAGGNCNIESLEPRDTSTFGLINFTSKMREYNWQIPEEVILFGGDGSNSTFGLWLPPGNPDCDDCPVIEIIESATLEIAGTSIVGLLTYRSAYYLAWENDASRALDALGVPMELRSDDADEELCTELARWADPGIPDPRPDSHRRRVTVEEIRETFG